MKLTCDLALALTRAVTTKDALGAALRTVCEATGWAGGRAWTPALDGSTLTIACTWVAPEADPGAFRQATVRQALERGTGLPDRCWSTRQTVWREAMRLPDAVEGRAGSPVVFAAGVAVPVVASDEVVAVLEFFVGRHRDEDTELATAVEAAAANVGGILGRQEAAEALAGANVELARSNAELEQFARHVAHDLGEPLRTIDYLTRRLADELQLQGRDHDELIVAIRDSIETMDMLIRDLLEHSRAGERPRVRTEAACSQLMEQALATLLPIVQEKRAMVVCAPLPTVHAYPVHLRRLFQNLLSNALKYSGEERPRIQIRAEREAAGWRFVMEDNGVGIPPEHAQRMFEPFRRGTSGMEKGTGMGLAICKRIVELHGGRLWVEPAAGGGSAFSFTLPDAAS
jgi:signal transduction histidine kinase